MKAKIIHKMIPLIYPGEEKFGSLCESKVDSDAVSYIWKKVTCPDCIAAGKRDGKLHRDWQPPLPERPG